MKNRIGKYIKPVYALPPTIEEVWQRYKNECLLGETTEQQNAAKLSFFAGSQTMWDMLTHFLETLDDETAALFMKKLNHELKTARRKISEGRIP